MKSLLLLTAALTFGSMASAQTSAAASAPQVPAMTDVPAGHWAKDAIDRLTSKGILLGYPDGTFRGTQNLTRYEAAVIIARLLDQINTGAVPAPQGEDLTALQNAVQELAADLAALGVRVSDLEENAVSKDDFSRLEARVESLSAANGDADAIAKIQSQIDDLSARADDYDTMRADVDDNASSIAALNDLTVLLNQDILDLQDRVSAVEAAQADFVQRSDFDNLSGKVTAIDTRVTKLENAPKFSIGGTVEAKYGRVTLKDKAAGDFDIDRLTNNVPFITGYFSNDSYCPTFKGQNSVRGTSVISRSAVRCADTSNELGDFKTTFTVGVNGIKTANGAVNIDTAHVGLTLHNGAALTTKRPETDTYVALSHADVSGATADGVKFSVNYDNGNDSNSKFKFNDYLFANDNDPDNIVYRRGIVATVDASSVSTLGPKLTVVSGTAFPKPLTKYGVTSANAYPTTPMVGGYFGARVSLNPKSFGTVGLSYAQGNAGTAVQRDAVGVDADGKIGPVAVSGVYVASYPTQASPDAKLDNAAKAGFVKFGVDYMGLNLNANYRYIDPEFENGLAGMSTNDAGYYSGMGGSYSSAPFGPNEDGFGVDGSYSIGPVKLGAYVNSFKSTKPNYAGIGYGNIGDKRQTAWGVNLGTPALRGASLTAFYNNAQLGDDKITELYGNNTNVNNYDQLDYTDPMMKNSSSYGVSIGHDGKAADALVKGLDVRLTYARFYDDSATVKDYKYDDVQATAKYSGKFGVLTVTPYVRYHYFHNPEAGKAVVDTSSVENQGTSSLVNYEGMSTEAQSYTTVKGGIQVTTDPMDIVTKPSLFGGIAARNTKFDTVADATTETYGNIGITLNEFILPTNKFSIGYSYYEGHRITDAAAYSPAIGVSSAAFSSSTDRIFSGASGINPWINGTNTSATSSNSIGNTNVKLSGVYGAWEGWGLKAAYGYFDYTNLTTNQKSTAQAFKVSTKITF